MNIKVSVIIPAHDSPELLKRALDSIPFDEDLETIVVDDCSGNDYSFIHEYPVRYYKLDKNRGANYARNFAIDHSIGEYIYGMDDDDYLYTDEFRKAIRELDGTDFVFVDCRVNSGDTWELNENSKYVLWAYWTKFTRREFIGDLKAPLNVKYAGDMIFFEELFKRPHTEKFTHIVAYHYNHPRVGSMLWERDHGS